MGMEVDSLEIKVEAAASSASQQLDILISKLSSAAKLTSTSVGNMRNYAKEVGRMAAAVQSFSRINIPNLSTLVTQLEQLSKINLKGLDKKINLDIQIKGGDNAGQLKYAIQKTLDGMKIDTSSMSKQLADVFGLKGSAATKLKQQVSDLAVDFAKAFDGNKFNLNGVNLDASLDDMAKTISENGQVLRSSLSDTLGGVMDEYKELYDYFNSHKIYVSDFLKAGVGKTEFNDLLQGNLRYITRDASKGIKLNDSWDELTDRFPTLLSKDTINDAEQLVSVLEAISRARDEIKPISIQDLAGDAKSSALGNIYDYLIDMSGNLGSKIEENIQKAMQASDGKLNLDININEDKIVQDIKNAINRASTVQYEPVKVKLDIDAQNIQNAVSTKLQGLDIGEMPQIAEGMKQISDAMVALGGVDFDGKKINTIINSIRRLATADIGSFNIDIFNQITQAITALGSAPDVSANLNRFISGLARLANAGQSAKQTADALPELSTNLRNTIASVSSAVDVSEPINAFVQSISRLASAGSKTGQTAAQLDSLTQAVMRFFQTMANAPQMSQSTVAMTQALAQLASAGGRVNTAADDVKGAFGKMSNSGNKLLNVLNKVANGIAKVALKIGSGFAGIVKKAASGLASGLSAVASGAGKAAKSVISAFTGIGKSSKHLNTATFSLKNLFRSLAPLIGIQQIFNWGKNAVKTASQLTEVQNVVDATFGRAADKIDDFARVSIRQFGMSQLTAKQIASRYQSMGVAMGFAQGEMADMSISLTKLAADMASFYDVSQTKVAESLEAIFTGQTRPLREYGLDLTQATLQEWALKQGLDANIQSMSQAEKTMLRYQYVMANTKAAAGDFSRTSNTWANQVRLLSQSFQELGAVLGNVFINAFGPALQALNDFMIQVISIVETIANALGALFGWTVRVGTSGGTAAVGYTKLGKSVMKVSDAMKSAYSNATKMDNGISAASESAGLLQSGIEEISTDATPVFTSGPEEAVDDLSGGLEDANDKAEELKRTLLGFDQINKLNDPTDKSGSGGGGGGGGGGGAGEAAGGEAVFERTKSLFDLMKSDIKSLEELGEYIGDALIKAMQKIDWDSIYEKARNFGTDLASFLNGLISEDLFDETGRLIANALNTALNFLNGFGEKFDWTDFGKSIAAGLNSFFKNLKLGLAADTFDKFLNGILDAIIAATGNIEWERIGAKIRNAIEHALYGIDWQKAYKAADQFGEGLAKFLNGLINVQLFGLIGDTLAKTLNTVLHFLDSFGTYFEWTEFGLSLAAGINHFFQSWDAGLTADTFTTFINGVLDALIAVSGDKGIKWSMIGEKIADCVKLALGGIEWEKAYEAFGNFGSGAAKFMNKLITPETFGAIGTSIANAVKSVIHGVHEWVTSADFHGWGVSLGTALNNFFGGISWTEVGLTLDGLIEGLVNFMCGLVETGQFEVFGAKIGEALSSVNWIGHLFKAGRAIIDAITDVLKGAASTPAGKFIEALGAAFVGIKMATALYRFVDEISTILGGDRNTRILKETLEKLLGNASEGAAKPAVEKFNPLIEGLKKVGEAAKDALTKSGLLQTLLLGFGEAGVFAGIVTGAKKVAEFVDAVHGGNGELSELGGFIDSISGSFTETFAQSLFKAKEELETANATTDQWAETLAQLFESAGVGSETLQEIFNNLGGSYNVTAEEAEMCRQIIELVCQSEENWSAEQQAHAEEAEAAYGTLKDALTTLQQDGIIPSQEHMKNLTDALDKAKDSGGGAKEMLDELKEACEKNSVPFEELEKVLGKDFVDALKKASEATSTNTKKISQDTKTNMDSAKKSTSEATEEIASKTETNMSKAADSVQKSTSSMKSDVEGTMPTVEGETTDAMTEAERISTEKWNEAYNNISESLSSILTDVREVMGDVMTSIQLYWQSVVINTNQIWELISKKVDTELNNAVKSVETSTTDMVNKFGDMKTSVDTTFSGIQSTIKAAVNKIQEMLTALKSKAQTVTDNVKKYFQSMVTSISKKISELKSIGTKGIKDFATGANSQKEHTKSVVRGIMDAVVTTINNYNSSLHSAGVSAGNSFANGFKSVHIPVPHIYVSGYSSHGVGNGGSVNTPNFGVSWYAKGGFPNLGEMFIARESGPELVGKIGNKNAVANNIQIEEGIRAAVVDGLMEVVMATSNDQNQEAPYVINMTVKTQDDEVLARAVERGRLKRDERYNPSMAY